MRERERSVLNNTQVELTGVDSADGPNMMMRAHMPPGLTRPVRDQA